MCKTVKTSWRDEDYDSEDRAWMELIEKMSPARRARLIALLSEAQKRIKNLTKKDFP